MPIEATLQPTPESAPVDQNGRVLGPRALNTRRRLLDSTSQLLRSSGFRELSVVDVAKSAGTSPATFYQYFRDINDAIYELAREAMASHEPTIEIIDQTWVGEAGLVTARRIIEAFVDLWERYGHVLRARDQLAAEGHERFVALRFDALRPILFHLSDQITGAQESRDVPAEIHPITAAAAMTAILERLVGAYPYLEQLGATRDHLVETCSLILYRTVTGRNAS